MGSNLSIALTFSLIAGLSTGIGGIIAVMVKRVTTKFMAFSLAFSAGIMITVSLSEMIPSSGEYLVMLYGKYQAGAILALSLVIGMILSCLAEKVTTPHNKKRNSGNERDKMLSIGITTAIVMAIHNFPEGIVTFMSSYNDVTMGLAMTLAIALHNIPEGMSVAVPVYYATNSRAKAIGVSFASGLTEPLGAVITYLFLSRFINLSTVALMYGVISGIMLYISVDELIPASYEYGHTHTTLFGILVGIILMSVGLVVA